MKNSRRHKERVAKAVHGLKKTRPDPLCEQDLAKTLKAGYSREALTELLTRFVDGEGLLDNLIRRAIWRALCKRFGNGVRIERGVAFKHIETFEIGDNVFIGANSFIQGRFDGRCVIGSHSWIGPGSYFDARDLRLGKYVGWGPGARVLGSEHTGAPLDVPIIKTDVESKPVRVRDWADIGTGATILPGVTVGKGAVIGAGAVVTRDVAPFTVAVGVPAHRLKSRKEGCK